MGGEVEEIIPARGYYKILIQGKEIPVCIKFRISADPLTGAEETKFKDVTYRLLRKTSIPTPQTISFYRKNKESQKEIKKRLSALSYPIIIKDAEGSQSKGVYANINSKEAALKTIKEAFQTIPRLVAQPMVFGNEYRVTVLGEKVIGALRMIPPQIVGNGKDSVDTLITKKQKATRRKTPRDISLKNILKEQGLTLGDIPSKGKIIFIRKNSCLAEGGETEDVTEKIHKKIIWYCAKATRATGKKLAGIDVICEDISKDPQKQNFYIIEVNGKPDIYVHYNPTHGKTRDVVRDIISYILKLK